ERAGPIGVPVPGVELKLVPTGDKLEVRVRGPHVTPGYWKRPDLTRAAFDEDGFYKPGDAVRFADPAEPAKGIVFDGRLAEDFKLATGTWVAVGVLRVAALAAASPALQDAIIASENTDKGYINQRLALERRKAEVERLFAPAPDADVLIVPARS